MHEAGPELRRPVDGSWLRARLGPRWGPVRVVAETTSSNADLLAEGQAPEGSVLVAEFQSAGRGRLDRVWVSPPGAGLTFSVLFRPRVAVASWGWLPLLAGVALRQAGAESTGVQAALKWPNDLLIGASGRKAAGILAQTSGPAVVLGVGINVSTTAEELGLPTATSLALAGAAPDRGELLVAVLLALDEWYGRWSGADGDAEACGLAGTYRQHCATIGQRVRITGTPGAGGRGLRGRAVGPDATGALQVEVDGVRQVIGAGDVEHVRPA